MRNYYTFSALLHALVLFILVGTSPSSPLSPAVDAPMSVEILAFHDGGAQVITPLPLTSTPPKESSKEVTPSEQPSIDSTPPVQPSPTVENKPTKSEVHAQTQEHAPSNSSSSVAQSTTNQDANGIQLDYAQQLKLFIEKNKFYPRNARKLKQTGLVRLRVEIDRNGNFTHVELVEGSHHPSLNQAALELIRGLQRFKPLPQDLQPGADFMVPIAYQLNGSHL
jgi:periplasmic protein TonB